MQINGDRFSGLLQALTFRTGYSIDWLLDGARPELRVTAANAFYNGQLVEESRWPEANSLCNRLGMSVKDALRALRETRWDHELAEQVIVCEFCLQQGLPDHESFEFFRFMHGQSARAGVQMGLTAAARARRVRSVSEVYPYYENFRRIPRLHA